MDNQNNSNLPGSDPNPAPVFPPQPTSPWPTPPQSPDPWAPTPEPTPTPTWTPPVQPEAAIPTPPPVPEPVFPETASTPPTPIPTFTPPSSIPAPVTNTTGTDASNLNNPWGAPTQPPTTEPSWTSTAPTESAPTDLSHLISDTGNTPPPAEALVVPSVPAANLEVPNLPAEAHKGIPKWVLGLGAVLLLLVIGASAYFILGIGQPAKTTTSLPAVTAPETANEEVNPPQPVATPAEQSTEQSAATGSANFGNLQGSGSAPQATSAAELLRQRSQGR